MGTGAACNNIPDNTTATTKEPGLVDTTLSQEDQEFLNNFYASLASYDSRYANGIGNIKIDVTNNSDEKEYQIKIGFPNDKTFNVNNLAFTLDEGVGMTFMGRCKDNYASEQKLDGSEITIFSNLTQSPNDIDVHFYRYLNQFTSEQIKSNSLER